MSERGIGGKRCVRYPVSFTNEQDKKITALAVACHMSKSELIGVAMELILNSENAINILQDRFNKNEMYRVRPIRENGKIIFY